MPKVSVVVPSFNRAALLPATLDSVLAQTYHDFEIIVVDDGSTDNTREVLTPYASRIRLVSQENRGEGGARNRGIQEAKGEFIAFLDSDDLWMPGKLEAQMAILGKPGSPKWAFSDAQAFEDGSGKVIFRFSQRARQFSGEVSRELLMVNFIPSPTVLVHRSVFDDLAEFSELKIGADWEMWLCIAATYPVARVPEILAGYRVHAHSVYTQVDVDTLLSSRLEVVRRAVARSPRVYARHEDEARSRQFVSAARGYLKVGDVKAARKAWWRAFRLAPTSMALLLTLPPLLLGGSAARRLISEYNVARDRAK